MKIVFLLLLSVSLFIFGIGISYGAGDGVEITPLFQKKGEITGEDRSAFKLVDPSGIVIVIDPGRTVDPDDFGPGSIQAILDSHAHSDHLGDIVSKADGSEKKAPETVVAKLAAKSGAKVFAMSELRDYLSSRIEKAGGDKKQANPIGIGGTVEVSGVKITAVQAMHSSGISAGEPGLPQDLRGYGGLALGFVIQFTNGLVVYYSGDTGLFGDMALISQFYGVKLALLNIGDAYTMGPKEAAYAVNQLIKPKTVIPMHIRQEGDKGKRIAQFISLVDKSIQVVPPSGLIPRTFNSKGEVTN